MYVTSGMAYNIVFIQNSNCVEKLASRGENACWFRVIVSHKLSDQLG